LLICYTLGLQKNVAVPVYTGNVIQLTGLSASIMHVTQGLGQIKFNRIISIAFKY